jgi:hypothetical protein
MRSVLAATLACCGRSSTAYPLRSNRRRTFDTADQQLTPFEVAVYGMCALVLLQSLFSLVAGIAVLRLLESLSDDL